MIRKESVFPPWMQVLQRVLCYQNDAFSSSSEVTIIIKTTTNEGTDEEERLSFCFDSALEMLRGVPNKQTN